MENTEYKQYIQELNKVIITHNQLNELLLLLQENLIKLNKINKAIYTINKNYIYEITTINNNKINYDIIFNELKNNDGLLLTKNGVKKMINSLFNPILIHDVKYDKLKLYKSTNTNILKDYINKECFVYDFKNNLITLNKDVIIDLIQRKYKLSKEYIQLNK